MGKRGGGGMFSFIDFRAQEAFFSDTQGWFQVQPNG